MSSIEIDDTILIHLSISIDSKFFITEIEGDSLTFNMLPQLQNQLYESISLLPKVEPALKRGVPVNTAFVLPLVLKTVE